MADRAEVGVTVGSAIAVEMLEPRSAPRAVLDQFHALQVAQSAEAGPHDKPTPIEVLAATWSALPDFLEVTLFLARGDSGRAVGYAYVTHHRTGEDRQLADMQMWAAPAHRRQGVAAALLEAVAANSEARGHALLRTTTTEGVGWGEDLCRHVGGRRAHDRRTWRLALSRVNRDEIRLTAAQAAERARGYVLEEVSGALPDAMVDDAVDLLQFLNDDTSSDIPIEDAKITVPILRDMEATWRAADLQRRWLFARHEPSGTLAGVADGVWQPRTPETIAQNNAVIRPEFRGRSLALWMKACLIDRLLDEWPDAVDIRTTTNFPDPTMDSVDERLGFEPYIRYTVWILEVVQLRAWLDRERA
ncbi:MAG TPA: GNAT family N-acetyltransferase [Acidimicrobiales bacterium]|nr:GNAT family N-acetyltransferase [Acidimicrobiales bacterium]